VALVASLREIRCHVIGIRCALEVLQVTGHASGAVQPVRIGAGVAVGALTRRNGVHARQRETGRRVVKRSIGPGDRVMALLARRRESGSGVCDWRRRVVVIGLVARYAGSSRKVVVVIDVAVGASPRWNGVRSRQRKSRAVVIEGRTQP